MQENKEETEELGIISLIDKVYKVLLIFITCSYLYLIQHFYLEKNELSKTENIELSYLFEAINITNSMGNLLHEVSMINPLNKKHKLIYIKELTNKFDIQFLSFLKQTYQLDTLKLLEANLLNWEDAKREVNRLNLFSEPEKYTKIQNDFYIFNKNLSRTTELVQNNLFNRTHNVVNQNNFVFSMISVLFMSIYIILIGAYHKVTSYIKETFDIVQKKNIQFIAQSKMAAVGELSAGVAHEINNPLMIIRSSSQLLEKKLEKGNPPKEDLLPELQKIKSTTDRIASIILGLKKISHQGSIDKKECNIEETIQNIIALIQEGLQSKGIEIRTYIDEDCKNLNVICNEVQIGQVFINIITNAKHAVSELKEKWIEIVAYREGKIIYFEISNSGPLIAPENRDKIFEPFFTTKTIEKGTGLGLSISKEILINHGGNINLKKETPHTTFIISLPIQGSIS